MKILWLVVKKIILFSVAFLCALLALKLFWLALGIACVLTWYYTPTIGSDYSRSKACEDWIRQTEIPGNIQNHGKIWTGNMSAHD